MLPYALFALAGGAIGFAISRNLWITGANALIGLVATYLTLPVIAVDHADPYVMLVVLSLVPFLATFILYGEDRAVEKRLAYGLVGTGAAVVLLLVIAFVSSASIFNARSYAGLIGGVEQVDQTALTDRLESFDQTQARFVDQALAENRAEELLGVQTGLASRVLVATPSIQSVDGRLTWIGALEHTGFAKWSSNDHTPGYYRVDQTNRADAEMVLEHEMTYVPSAFFGQDLSRAIYEAGYWDIGYTDFTLELDDSGQPFWVVSLYEHQVGFMGSDAVGVLVVDPATGEMSEYPIDEAPAWIDRVHPAEFLETQLGDWGVYRHGWWNAFWSESAPTMKTTRARSNAEVGMYFVRTRDGAPGWYTGMQSTKADRGTQGYVVVDARTKAATYYSFAGVTEAAVQEAIEGKVAEKEGYASTHPIPYNVNGHLTHIAVLKDQNGNPQLYGMASASNRDWVAVGETPREALRLFVAELRQQNYAQNLEGRGNRETFEGAVSRIGQEVIDGASTYYLTLVPVDGKAFRVPGAISSETALTQPGDRVSLQVFETQAAVLEASSFDNLAITLEKSPGQQAVEAYREEVDAERANRATEKRFEQLQQSLSPEKKRDLLDRLDQDARAD